jgi:phosphohistidine phosphatase
MKLRRLMLVRHGQAELVSGDKSDFQRRLDPQGKKDVLSVGKQAASENWAPECILCSEAVRARETLEILKEHVVTADCKVVFLPTIYQGEPSDLLNILSKLPPEIEKVMVVGHNPILSVVASELLDDPRALGTSESVLLTVQLEENAAWDKAFQSPWTLDKCFKPV